MCDGVTLLLELLPHRIGTLTTHAIISLFRRDHAGLRASLHDLLLRVPPSRSTLVGDLLLGSYRLVGYLLLDNLVGRQGRCLGYCCWHAWTLWRGGGSGQGTYQDTQTRGNQRVIIQL